ncbi:MAG: macro domain-containing protein [Patescibacteria group bacterium]|jgi:O-acetyl-ADP-ribose deacetylase (regulator of RNase III)
MMHYVTGDATAPQGQGPSVIVHVCNDIGAWGAGFVLAISAKWSEPETQYRAWHKEGGSVPFELGATQIVAVEKNLWVANMIGQHKIKPRDGVPPVRYEAIKQCLNTVAIFAKEQKASVHMPRIGCGLAGGTWAEIGPIVEKTLVAQGVDVYVYDLPK